MAITLARAGLKAVLLDKARFPRQKLCGGLISLRCRDALRQAFGPQCDPPIEAEARGAKVFFRERLLNEVRDYKPICFTSRSAFDHYLLDMARAFGVEVIEGAGASGLSPDRTAVLANDDVRHEAPFIIGADGASSRIRKELASVAIDKRGFAVGLEMEVPRSLVSRDICAPEIYLGLVRWGYAWIFPKERTLTVGVGGLSSENPDMRPIFERFARMAIGSVPALPLLRHPIPFGNYLAQPGEGSVLLAGDAAGLVEPITGEGIAFAILSGYHAAHAVIEARAAHGARSALSFYRERYGSIAGLFDDGRLLRYLVFSRPLEPLFVRALGAGGGLIRKHMDVVAGDADYRDYSRYLTGAALRRLPRMMQWRGGAG
ncbi:NAD(P)/FAD-dependent oxidoreductase [Noviherbaspirillum cavernae]|uniref:NAD(P)/FAD-dependent oxidoreductase n=1 Tax=Noviherbaspirillum cavernae TaxID=2320862 RepID=UPI001F5BCDC8|nr:geranylgeranyl reductase family protein [Noviherbaspirillum cavernae]